MKVYLLSLAVGVLVGCIYGILNVRSPAPPIVALVGLLGILVGEQIPPLVRAITTYPSPVAWWDQVGSHMFGQMPDGRGGASESTNNVSNSEE